MPETSLLAQAAAKIKDPSTTGYYTDALDLLANTGWLAHFKALHLHIHSSTHPPGPILWYTALIHMFAHNAPRASAVLISALAAASVFVMYWHSSVWTKSRETRLLMTLIWSLSPALLLIYPEFDQVYPLITLVLLVSGHRALRGSLPWALVFGLGWFAATLMAFQLLVLVPFFAIFAGWRIRRARRFQMPIVRQAVWGVVFTLTIFSGLHLLLYVIYGYNTIATFFHAWEVQKTLERSRPHTLLTPWINLYDFALGLGYVPLLLFAMAAVRTWIRRKEPDAADMLTGTSALTILIVAFSGRLDYETARVWMFLQPLIIAPAALELIRWTRAERFLVVSTLVVLTATIGRQLWFL